MNEQKLVISAIVKEIMESLPSNLTDIYSDPPGRRPSPKLIQIKEIQEILGRDKCMEIITDVVDATISSMLSLMDSNFKELNIAATFKASVSSPDSDLLYYYRELVDPGGVLREQ